MRDIEKSKLMGGFGRIQSGSRSIFLTAIFLGVALSPLAASETDSPVTVSNLNSGQDIQVKARDFENYFSRGDRITVHEKSGRVQDLIFSGIGRGGTANFGGEISGAYVSEITTNLFRYFGKKEQREIVIVFEQNGDEIIGTNEDFDIKIIGSRFSRYISFYILPGKLSQSYEITGKWKMNADSSRLAGSWEIKGSPSDARGYWNLTRVGAGQGGDDAGNSILEAWSVSDNNIVEITIAEIEKIEIRKTDKQNDDLIASNSNTANECESDGITLEAIDNVRTEWEQVEYSPGVYDLILQAEAAMKPPECDGVRARILADEAMELILLADRERDDSEKSETAGSTAPSGTITKESLKRTEDAAAEACWDVMDAMIQSFYGITITPVTTVACIVSAIGTASTGASIKDDQQADNKLQQLRFATITKSNLIEDMARGRGEYLAAMAYLQGCPVEVHDTYAEMVRRDFSQILPDSQTDAASMLTNLDARIAQELILAERCGTGT